MTGGMIALRRGTWAVVLATILLLLFITFALVVPYPLESWYYRTQVAPDLHKDLGFVAELVRVNPDFPDKVLVITFVAPDGAFARAGIRAGDIPFDSHGPAEISFYGALERARGGVAHVEVTRPGGSSSSGDIGLLMKFEVKVPGR